MSWDHSESFRERREKAHPSKPRLKTKSEALRVLNLIRKSITETTSLGKISTELGSTPFKVLISTILSARTRDPVTEEASARLSSRFPDSRSLSKANAKSVAKLIRPVSFYRVKAGRIIKVARIIEKEYNGIVPSNLDQLLALPGVGRKTANCVLVYGFRTPAIPVDVHVHRISNRIGLVETTEPERTEEQLSILYKEKYWLDVNELFVRFGQTICKPIGPLCEICSVKPMCNYYQFVVKKRMDQKKI
jgi:endonuclease III